MVNDTEGGIATLLKRTLQLAVLFLFVLSLAPEPAEAWPWRWGGFFKRIHFRGRIFRPWYNRSYRNYRRYQNYRPYSRWRRPNRYGNYHSRNRFSRRFEPEPFYSDDHSARILKKRSIFPVLKKMLSMKSLLKIVV